jgi:hypothetical protein
MRHRYPAWYIPAYAALSIAGPAEVEAQTWRVQAAAGIAYNVPTTLSVVQAGEPEIRIRARFESRALDPPIHWIVRVERAAARTCWAVELMHHKLYLQDPPADIQHFEITHGFDVLSLQRGWVNGGTTVRLGIGAIMGHAENTVRGRKLDDDGGFRGYHFAGPGLQAAAGRRFELGRGLHLFGEVRALGARVHVPVDGGHADLWHLSGHVLAGVGLSLRRDTADH